MADLLKPAQVLTGKVRFSFLNVFEAKETLNKGTFKYSVQLLIPKTDKKTVDAIVSASKVAFEDGQSGTFKLGKSAAVYSYPLRDGDAEHADDIKAGNTTYKGMFFLNASANKFKSAKATEEAAKYEAEGKDISQFLANPPTVLGPDGSKLFDRANIYSGCWGRALINFYPFNAKGVNKGVACGLNAVQLLTQGEALGGGGSVEAIFNEIPADDEI